MRKVIVSMFLAVTCVNGIWAAGIQDFKQIAVKNPTAFTDYARRELELFTRQKFPVSGEKAADGVILLETDTSLPRDGYSISLRGKRAVIRGSNVGVLYGAYAFLRHFGWEFYAPGCIRAPSRQCGDFEERKAPAFGSLRTVGLNFADEAGAYRQPFVLLRLGYSPFRYETDWTLSSWIPAGLYENNKHQSLHTSELFAPRKPEMIRKHPEFYARDRRGKIKGLSSHYGVPALYHACTSNPELRKTALRKVLRWLEKSPRGKLVWIGQGDGNGWCECSDCLKLDPIAQPEGRITAHMADRHLNFVNYIAREAGKKYPGIGFVFTVYGATTQPPVREIPEKNVVLQFCPYLPDARCFSHDLHCPLNREFLKNMQTWRAKFPGLQCIVFDYVMNYSNRHAFFFPHDAMEKKLAFYLDNGAGGVSFCGEPRHLMEYFFFIQGRLLWEPKMEKKRLDALKKEFLLAFYGPAAETMARYIRLATDRVRANGCQGIYSGRSEISDREFILNAEALLNRAEREVPANSPFAARIRFDKAGVLFTDLLHYSVSDPVHRLKTLKEYRRICAEFPRDLAPSFVSNAWAWIARDFLIPMTVPAKVHGWKGNRTWYRDPALNVLDRCHGDADFQKLCDRLQRGNPLAIRQNVTAE